MTVPSGLSCLMSAISEGSKSDDTRTTFFFKQVRVDSFFLSQIIHFLLRVSLEKTVNNCNFALEFIINNRSAMQPNGSEEPAYNELI